MTKNKTNTVEKQICKGVKDLFGLLVEKKATARHPLFLSNSVTIAQTIDSKDRLDQINVSMVWHDRTTVIVETDDNKTVRLIDSFSTASDGHCVGTRWDVGPLIDTVARIDIQMYKWIYSHDFCDIIVLEHNNNVCKGKELWKLIHSNTEPPTLPSYLKMYFITRCKSCDEYDDGLDYDLNDTVQCCECALWEDVELSYERKNRNSDIIITDSDTEVPEGDYLMKVDWSMPYYDIARLYTSPKD